MTEQAFAGVWMGVGLMLGMVATLRLFFKIPVRRAMEVIGIAMGVVMYIVCPFVIYSMFSLITTANTPLQAGVPGLLAGMCIAYLLAPWVHYFPTQEKR